MIIYIFEDDDLLNKKYNYDGFYYADSVIKIGKENKIVKNRKGSHGKLKSANAIKYLLELLRDNDLLPRSQEAKLRLKE